MRGKTLLRLVSGSAIGFTDYPPIGGDAFFLLERIAGGEEKAETNGKKGKEQT